MRGLVYATVFVIGGGWFASRGSGKTPSLAPAAPSVIVLQPPDGCTVTSKTVRVIAVSQRAPVLREAKLDGKPLAGHVLRLGGVDGPPNDETQSMTPRSHENDGARWVLVATAHVQPGPHKIEIGTRRVRFQVASPAASPQQAEDDPPFQFHPPDEVNTALEGCAACHGFGQTSRGVSLGEPATPDACFRCHGHVDFELTHAHRVAPLRGCQMCHQPHGATQPALLRGDARALCARCHE